MKTSLYILLIFTFSSIASSQEVEIELFASGFNSPLEFRTTGAPGDNRIFVVEQGGVIKIAHPDGSVEPVPFLDISGQISSGGERGLLGLAFHPDFENNGYFFVNYTDPNGDTQVSRFSVSGDPNIADPNSEFPIISYEQPFSNHNGGCLAFGPDGYLYIATGDGGSGGDPGNRAQNLNVLLGKILRLDIDNPSGGNNYGIPSDNPFIGDPNALDEIWAYGLRNPWRFSFDAVAGNIWIGDVGQGNVEEIDCQPVSAAGLNYGWRCYEGSDEYDTSSNCPPESELTFPFAEYSSATGSGNCSVTGGFVYRGSVYSDILGLYFFADYCSGLIGTVDVSGTIMEHGNFDGNWVSFGKDAAGELYIVDIGGSIYKVKGSVLSTKSFNSNMFSLLPNPASGKVILKTEQGEISKVSIFSLAGEKVFSKENIVSQEIVLPISNLKPGVYLVKIETKNSSVVVKKLVVE